MTPLQPPTAPPLLPSDRTGRKQTFFVDLPPPLLVAPCQQPPLSGLEGGRNTRRCDGCSYRFPDPLLDSIRVCGLGSSPSDGHTTAPGPLKSPAPRQARRHGGSNGVPEEKGLWRRMTAVARCAGLTLGVAGRLIAAALATLMAFWSLFPVCTACGRVRGDSLAAETAAVPGGRGAAQAPYSTLRINQLQVVGTHNSYHQRTKIPLVSGFWPYHFPSLSDQLDAGVRHLELDVHFDWKTSRWFVYHISVADPLSTCNCFLKCLDEIKMWSDRNPTHHILFIDVELKLTGDFLQICGKHTPDTDRFAFLTLQETVLEVFPPDRVLTPKQVRGEYPTIFEAVKAGGSCNGGSCSGGGSSSNITSADADSGSASPDGKRDDVVPKIAGGWPLVDDTRGMVVFVLDYQTVNMDCRKGVRAALPVEETVFFEKIPTYEVFTTSPYAAFTQACMCSKYWRGRVERLVNLGFIVRQHPKTSHWIESGTRELRASATLASNETYLADTSAQLLVSDDLRHAGTTGVCRSRCTPQVPEEECILEGFC